MKDEYRYIVIGFYDVLRVHPTEKTVRRYDRDGCLYEYYDCSSYNEVMRIVENKKYGWVETAKEYANKLCKEIYIKTGNQFVSHINK